MKNLILILLTVLSTITFSQDRVNLKPIKFDTLSKKINNVTGWAYNDELGEWLDYKNKISEDKNLKTRVNSEYWYILEDFSSLQFGIILEDYYVLIVNEGESTKKAFVFEQSEYNKIINIFTDFIEVPETGKWIKTFDTIQGQIIESGYWVADKTKYEANTSKLEVQSINILCGISEYSENEEDFLKRIRSAISESASDYSSYQFIIKRTTSNGKDVIRFNLPSYYYSYSEIIDKRYFEISSKEFKSFVLQ